MKSLSNSSLYSLHSFLLSLIVCELMRKYIYEIPPVEGNTNACFNLVIIQGGIVTLYTQ
jgi:hypothetical protein